MKKVYVKTILAIVVFTLVSSCKNSNENKSLISATETKAHQVLRENVLTKEEQKAISPDGVVQILKEGNNRYINNMLTAMNDTAMMHHSYKGQYPEAFILSCIDSRVPVEEVFDKGIGDLFVCRIAGNIVDEDILGSMEYGCKEAGAKLIVVLGHESCGAVKAAIENVQMGNITAMLAKIQPAISQSANVSGEHNVENPAFVEAVVKYNVFNMIQTIRSKSPILKEMEDKGEIKVVGAYYKLNTGEVIFLDGK
jgi:carbonic anhydrase